MKRFPILSRILLLLVCFRLVLSVNADSPPDPWLYYGAFGGAGSVISNILVIPKVEFSPTVDGELDADWTFPEIGMFVYVTNDFPEGGAADMSAHYRVAWNDDGLYFFGRVFDDSIDVSHQNSWERDCWEIYIDGDDSKGSSYDGVDDVQWRFVYGAETADGGQAPNAEIAWMATEIGWDFELAIPASDLADTNIVLTEGAVIGWEVQVADNDGGDRAYMTKWWSNSNDSYLNPSLFGTAGFNYYSSVLETPESLGENIELSVPSVFNSRAVISYAVPARSSIKLKLYNIAGQIIRSIFDGVRSAGTYTMYFDASDFANGIYLCRLEACSTNTTQKVLVLK